MSLRTSPLLLGDNTIPGCKIPEDRLKLLPTIFQKCKDWGLDFYPTIIEKVTWDEMSEIAAYGGFPIRYPHYRFGMEFEELSRSYDYGFSKIFELVINSSPCYIYCLDSNSLLEDILVICHALGHNDFFKNNVFFAPTNKNMMNVMADHALRIRRYMDRWGKETVTQFIDNVLCLETLVDFSSAWKEHAVTPTVKTDKRVYRDPKRLYVEHEYMDEWVNPKGYLDKQKQEIAESEVKEYLDLFKEPERDILAYLKDHARLRPWQQDIIAMLYNESLYFTPQRFTKLINEGWASYVDHHLMAVEGLASLGQERSDMGIIDYAIHKALVLGGKYSMNPYNLGYELLLDIERRWNEGRFGQEYEDCIDAKTKEEWDKQLGKGKEKVFEVRKHHNDFTLLFEYFTEEFCRKHDFFEWKRYGNEDKIESRDFKKIKKKLLNRYTNGGLPDIRLADPNHKNKGWFLLEHYWTGEPLYEPYISKTMNAIYAIWDNVVVLVTKKSADDDEVIYVCHGTDEDDITVYSREKYETLL